MCVYIYIYIYKYRLQSSRLERGLQPGNKGGSVSVLGLVYSILLNYRQH